MELGSQSFIHGFEEGVVGMKIDDEKEIHLEFPSNYHQRQIAGKPVVFQVKLKGLFKKSLPELNDELASKKSSFQTLEELKNSIRDGIKGREEARIQDELENRVLEALVEHNPIEVPKSLHENRKQEIILQVQRESQSLGMDARVFEEYKAKHDESFNHHATVSLKSAYLVASVADEKGLDPTEGEVFQELERRAQSRGVSVKDLKGYYEKEGGLPQVSQYVKQKKVLNFLLTHAKVVEVPKAVLKALGV